MSDSNDNLNLEAMSDEEFLHYMENDTSTVENESEDDISEEESTSEDVVDSESEEDASEDMETEEEESEDTTEDESDSEEADNTDTEENSEEDSTEIDVKGFYEKITAPFKANGKELKIDTPEEAIQLMQMGAGYVKKMTEIKPYMQVIKTLEKHNVLSADKINFAIDLLNNDKKAILKLVKDANIDLNEVEDTELDYSSKNKIVSENEVEFDEIVSKHANNPKFTELTEEIKSWDSKALTQVAEDPRVIDALMLHKEAGIYDQISAEVNRARVLNDPAIAGKNDFEAYFTVGGILHAKGALNNQSKPPVNAETIKGALKKSTAKAPVDKKSAAAPSNKPKKPTPKINEDDLAKLSDEEFVKMASKLNLF